ncbi:isocitrate lyase/PEP mutase family protein [Plantibacter sp. Mn2098]|uniref:isocitrate lyase/PEP mutase family protein n=1 Tax=Plantibacter sp. Mn2098 TaxID=3395266 RepID=UPI003BC3C3CE
MSNQAALALAFADLHVSGTPVLLPNAWDVASARVVAAAGARAIATTSAGVAWSLGFHDGEGVPRDLATDAVARIVRSVDLPVTADIERGFGDDPAVVGESVGRFIAAGVVGVNIEDSMRPVAEQVERLRAARTAADDAGLPLFINARIDTHRLAVVGDEGWLAETVDRALAYTAAGASGVFVLGALRADAIRALAGEAGVPVNVAFGPGTLSVPELAAAGASRISAGSSIAEAAYSLVADQAAAMLAAASPIAAASLDTAASPILPASPIAPATGVPTPPSLSYAQLNSLLS